ncbi:Thioredoxin-like fold containing protein [Parasponia andersonii]|uniref:Thioredoxin-like fold containing protein n=1 Tax=Parasponia andersonii TaxID=3476 RepID=A0A2P5DAC8_PARAD|nr:Thioredoxin-like fold containing protein [Parasponia andersonii]
MKGVKGKLLKKIKSIRPVGYLKLQDRVLQVIASDGYVDSCPKNVNVQVENESSLEKTEPKTIDRSSVVEQEPDVIDVAELMKDLEDEEDMEFDEETDDKENIGPPVALKDPVFLERSQEISARTEQGLRERRVSDALELSALEPDNCRQIPLTEINVSSFRRPDLNSYSLFDPKLLAAFQQAVMEHIRMSEAEREKRIEEKELKKTEEEQEPPTKAPRVEDADDNDDDPFLEFDEKCPPGGSNSVVLYTTTLRGIRKTYEGCSSIRFLLESFRVLYCERDVSMHSEFREELRRILDGKAVPPKLFIRGRYIGGAEEVLGLHEQGKLRPLFKSVQMDRTNGPCEGCGGVRFLVCFNCNGSHKVIAEDGQYIKCHKCNENGLIICPFCC